MSVTLRRMTSIVAGSSALVPIVVGAFLYAYADASKSADGGWVDVAQAEPLDGELRPRTGSNSDRSSKRAAPARPASPAARAIPLTGSPPAQLGGAATQDSQALNGGAAVPNSAAQASAAPVAFISTTAQHAASAKLSRCVPLIGQATQFTATAPTGTLSQWSSDRPDDHMFQSLIGLGPATPASQKSAAVLVASPEGKGCEATLVQIRPVARACGDIEADLKRQGVKVTDLAGLTVLQTGGTGQEMLVPATDTGCVVVGIALALNR